MKNIAILLLALALLNVLDYKTTVYGLSTGKMVEGNPLARKLIEAGKFMHAKFGMSVVLLVSGIVAWRFDGRPELEHELFIRVKRITEYIMMSTVAMYVLVVLNNLWIILR